MIKKNNEFIFISVLYSLLIGVIYSPAYLNIYAFSDDFILYYKQNVLNENLLEWDILSGRPLYAILRYSAQQTLGSLGAFSFQRFFCVVTIIAFCVQLYFFLKERMDEIGRFLHFIVPLMIACLPSIVIFGAWASCFPYVLSILFAGLSYAKLNKINKEIKPKDFFISYLFLALSFSIYQPTGMTYAFYMLIDLCLNNKKLTIIRVIKNSVMILAGMLTSLFLSKVLSRIIFNESISRTSLADSLYDKFNWFINSPLHDSLNNYSIFYNKWYFSLSVIFFLISLLLIYMQVDGFKKLILCALIIIGSFSPNLVIAESWGSYRSIVSLSLVINIVTIFSLIKLSEKIKPLSVVVVAITIFAMSNCYKLIDGYFVQPFKIETALFKNILRSTVDNHYDGYLIFDITDPVWDVFAQSKFDEYGIPSMQIPWAVSGMSWYIRNELGYNFKIKSSGTASNNVCSLYQKQKIECKTIKVTEVLRGYKKRYPLSY